jgi:DNA-binding Xre family transcriptional regulator
MWDQRDAVKRKSHMWDASASILPNVPRKLRTQLGAFLKQRRGESTYAQYARRIAISKSTLQRLEQGEQNITIDTLEHLLGKLSVHISDVFPED